MDHIDGDKGNDGTDEQQGIERIAEQQIEGDILSIIKKIENDRNRACVQNIHTFINRRGINMEVEEVRKLTESLVERNVIIDKGKQDKESFYVVDLIAEDEQINNEEKNDPEHVSSFNALHEFIDEEFHTILSNKIKSEVKLALNELINNDSTQNIKHNNHSNNINDNNLKENKSIDDLISTLKEEINFLRN